MIKSNQIFLRFSNSDAMDSGSFLSVFVSTVFIPQHSRKFFTAVDPLGTRTFLPLGLNKRILTF